MRSSGTRRRIMQAALACFLEEGYERTTIARIRARSAVSNGALFHHFRSKEAIADALYVESIASFQQGLWQLIRSRPRSLRAAVRATISHQLEWVEQNAELARFVYMRGHLDWDSPAGAAVASMNRDLARAFREWMAPLVQAGEVRPMPMLTMSAIVSGPAHVLARRWLAGQLDRPLGELADGLADAAWAGLRGRPLPARAAQRGRPARGRVTLELIGADGALLARGQATAELVSSGQPEPEPELSMRITRPKEGHK